MEYISNVLFSKPGLYQKATAIISATSCDPKMKIFSTALITEMVLFAVKNIREDIIF